MDLKCDVRWPREILKCCFQPCAIYLRSPSISTANYKKINQICKSSAYQGEKRKKGN